MSAPRAGQFYGAESGQPVPDDVRAFFERPGEIVECPECGRTVEAKTSAHYCAVGHDAVAMEPRS